VEVLGLDHIYLAVSDMDRSEQFYDQVMQLLGFRKGDKPIAYERHAHYFNPSLQITIRPARSMSPHNPYAPGLHHLCLQLPSREEVDSAAASLRRRGIAATVPKLYPAYSRDYYATFFEDPDGLRFELVSRTSDRDDISIHWDRFTVFLNPLSDFLSRNSGVRSNAREPGLRRATLDDVEGIQRCLDAVARERRWLGFLEAPPLDEVRSFIAENSPIQFIVEREGDVVGWCDVTPSRREGFRHTGTLGMGLLEPFRRRGLGRMLLEATLEATRAAGLSRVELEVLSSNTGAIALYKKSGFVQEGRKRAARVLDGRTEDVFVMALVWPRDGAAQQGDEADRL